MLKEELKKGKIFLFRNEDHTLVAEVSYGRTLGGGKEFKIYFNGCYVKITKTFKPIEKKLLELMSKYQLTTMLDYGKL